MSDSPQIRPNYQKHLLLIDLIASSSPIIQRLLTNLAQCDRVVEIHEVDQIDTNELLSLLSKQKMGTFLYIAGSPKTVQSLYRIAAEAGFTESEIEVIRFGEADRKLFCAGCQHIFDPPAAPQVTCEKCGLLLTVTDHYSPRLDAYLGYHEIK